MAKKNRKNPLDAEAKKQLKKAEEAIAEAAEAELEETADAVTEDIGDSADRAAEALEEAAEAIASGAEPEPETETETEYYDADRDEESTGKKPKKEKKQRTRTSAEEKERALNKVKRRKKLKYGTLATVITAVVLASVVLVNIICNVLDKRYNWNIDLTSSGLYEIDEQTVDYLHKLNKDIDIAVMASEDDFEQNSTLKVVEETLNRFKAEANGHIGIEYIDMTKHPEAVQQYSQGYDGDFASGDIVVRSGDLVRVIAFDDVIKTTQTPNYMTMSYDFSYSFIGEQSLVSAIMGVTDLNPIKVGVITKTAGQPIYYDYDSLAYNQLLTLLEKNNYIVTELDLASDAFTAADYDLVVLCSPFNDPSEAQIQKLTDYLYNGGQYNADMVYFSSFYQQSTPNLDAFLELWGMKIANAVVMEGNDSAAQVVGTALGQLNGVPAVSLTENDLNASAAGAKLPTVVPLSRPLELLFTDPNNGRETQALLNTAGTAYLRPLDVPADQFSENDAETGSFTLAAISENKVAVDNAFHSSRIAAFGTSWIVDPNITESKSYSNAAYFISVLNTLTGKEAVLTIAEKSLDTTSVTITAAQANAIRTVTVIIIPLLVAVIGLVVYVRRRNL